LFFGLFGRFPLQLRWLLVLAVLTGLLIAVGREITGAEQIVQLRSGRAESRFSPGRFDGILIDSRNKISLSRLQLVLWTLVVLSAWTTLALHRVIPVLQGRLLASDTLLVDEVAGILAGTGETGEAERQRAGALVEQITGQPLDDAADDAGPTLYAPLDIGIPQEILVALGISLASLAGAGLIKTNQATNEVGRGQEVATARTESALARAADMNSTLESMQHSAHSLEMMMSPGLESLDADPVDDATRAAAEARLAALETELRAARASAARANTRAAELAAAQSQAVGDLHANTAAADARWSDMLRGDSIANFQFTDLGKVQMFLFTIVLVFSYAALVWSVMSMPQAAQVLQVVPSMSLPAFSDSLVITMALSHGGYLATKTTV
jgi:hypothetical protein